MGEKTKENQEVKGRSVFRSAMSMSAGTLSSRVLGLVRDIILGALFSRTVTDAFTVAFRLPNMFRRLLGEGSLAVSFMPVYLEKREKQGPEAAAQLSSAIYSIVFTVVSVLSVLGIFFMEPIIGFLVSGEGFLAIEGKLELTITLGRVMFVYLFLVSNYAFFSAILQANKYFFIPALAPALFNLTFIVSSLIPQSWSQIPGYFLATGVVAGGFVQAGLVAATLVKQGALPRIVWRWNIKGVRVILINMVPGTIGMGILQLMAIVNVNYASRLPEGSHSYIYWGDRILELPQSLIAISLGAALLPTLSEFWSRNQKDEVLKTAQRYMRVFLFLGVPSAVGMHLLAQPIVEVLFMRGKFTADDALVTSEVVKIYAFLLLASGLTKVTVPNFYAIKNTWLPAVSSCLSLVAHVVLAPILMEAHGLRGLVASTMAAGTLNAVIILTSFRVLIGPLAVKKLAVEGFKILVAAVLMGALTGWLFPILFSGLDSLLPQALARGIALFATIGASVGAYFLAAHYLAIEEANVVIGKFRKKIC